MIRNQWYVVLESGEVGRRHRHFQRLGESLVFFRDNDDRLHCLLDLCCHRGAALSAGRPAQPGVF